MVSQTAAIEVSPQPNMTVRRQQSGSTDASCFVDLSPNGKITVGVSDMTFDQLQNELRKRRISPADSSEQRPAQRPG